MEDAINKIQKKVSELADKVETPEDVLRLANTLATLANTRIQNGVNNK